MKIIVFGGSGFLGQYVCDELLIRNHKITIFDKELPPQRLLEKVKFIKGDIKDEKKINVSIKNQDIVYNFAGLSDLNYSLDNPQETYENNILSNIYILSSCKKFKIKRYFFASSVYVYSQQGGFYKCSKQACEDYIREFNNRYNLKYTILRFGSIYGPGSDLKNGVYKIIKNALDKKKIDYEGDENSIREYIHVRDAAYSCVDALDHSFENDSIVLTGRNSINVKDFLKMIAEILMINPKKIHFKNKSYPGHYVVTPYSYLPKPGKKYVPNKTIDLGQGIIDLIEFIKREEK